MPRPTKLRVSRLDVDILKLRDCKINIIKQHNQIHWSWNVYKFPKFTSGLDKLPLQISIDELLHFYQSTTIFIEENASENVCEVAAILSQPEGVCLSRVSCQKGPTRHAYAWQIGPFWQDTLDICTQEPVCHLFRAQGTVAIQDRPQYSSQSQIWYKAFSP